MTMVASVGHARRKANVYPKPRVDHARELRARLDEPEQLCAALGLDVGRQRQANGVWAACPAHDDREPSLSVRVAEDGTIGCKCFACGWTGDALSLVAVVRGLDALTDFPRVLEEAAALCGYEVGRRARQTRPRSAPDRALRVALMIDGLASDWLRGLDMQPAKVAATEAAIATLTGDEAVDVFAIFERAQRNYDAETAQRDAELDRLACAWEAEHAAS